MRTCKLTGHCVRLLFFIVVMTFAGCRQEAWPPGVQEVSDESPILTPEKALETFYLPPGFDIELVAAEPLIGDPIAIDFDPDGRIWVVEMRGYMPNIEADGEREPVGQVVVLEDTTGNGIMDTRTVYMDNLVLPRAIKVLDDGVLVGAPPWLWMTKDTTGDLRADVIEVVMDDFGNPDRNPEYNPNGLLWGMDNYIHNTQYEHRFRYKQGELMPLKAPNLGQWGISMDDYGRLYRNFNSGPLRIDYIPSHYQIRNEYMNRMRGVYQSAYRNRLVWPVRPTTGVNRGYRVNELRDDNTLRQYTSASSLTVFRGDRLPEELRGNVFVPEPAGNLVQRYVLTEQDGGLLEGHNPYEEVKGDFLTSTDERFRPVDIYSAPDGTLYIVDMYRGIIQHRYFLTEYLKNEIRERDLERPLGLGRIYRIVHQSKEPDELPRLSAKSHAELVHYLEHPNGWWRDTAQRLLVERQARDQIPALERLVLDGEKDYIRLHALWTLDGIDGVDTEIIRNSLADSSPHIRSAAIRIAEPKLTVPDYAILDDIMELIDDHEHIVIRQLTASLGELPVPERQDALLSILVRYGDDPITSSLITSALSGYEFEFLEKALDTMQDNTDRSEPFDAVETLAITIMNRDDADEIRTMLSWIGDMERPDWQRISLLTAVDAVAPVSTPTNIQLYELDDKPEGIMAAVENDDDPVKELAMQVAGKLHWPGKPRPEVPSSIPLTAEEQKRFEFGERQYTVSCMACHQPDGGGMEGMATSLVNSEWVLGRPDKLIRIILHGMDGDEMLMPPVAHLSDEEIAAITTYIRREWGHEATPVDSSDVFEVRGVTTGRDRPWTKEELRNLR